jgi:benzoyl-CoA 2,3-dioxygenase component B
MNSLQRDWHDVFRAWQADIDLDPRVLEGYTFQAKFDDLGPDGAEIPFGHFGGQPRWERLSQVPHAVRDQLFDLIVVQGDTEFASVEQQKGLVASAPSDYDLRSLIRVMREEMRHGYQMCHLLREHFGSTGARASLAQLERRSGTGANKRLLGAFNAPVDNWLDFFTYTEFVDRDGKFQLLCLSHSGFAPLARSTRYMLKEESFHLGTGHTGLTRVIQAGHVPRDTMQRYFNKWVPIALDLFGNDNSTSAAWAYERSLKGRPYEMDDQKAERPADREHLNEWARDCYIADITTQIERLNRHIAPGVEPLRMPDPRFGRHVGTYKDQTWSIAGELLRPEEFESHVREVTPTGGDRALIEDLQRDSKTQWVAPRGGESAKE